uniref:EF-hand domain-containing protein n=1 Tax=Pseudictyota dubia TaxID=2749911 RepID=A0A7R9Z8Y4_9STRA|mmetsp:Transcript_28228/g.52552  ORF Transcript_28228/g.52552 Transcript_28228/m.52552 type:complete len:182 (+) Transcript_28228:124-669(+)|eukprot:CAMPEP_0197434164 /NCGR_PEP_ID=MMETSP1175-20131217/1935_1 /TAXON_ID=1003142 /ORGANISM="Triceratium dubium, Strain CCMP147" /LENGTH=181 /DNA_ID=CAMNT_0042962783 /DNA_START=124 /DNA_END=669 /DNA_ORIENTATION=+
MSTWTAAILPLTLSSAGHAFSAGLHPSKIPLRTYTPSSNTGLAVSFTPSSEFYHPMKPSTDVDRKATGAAAGSAHNAYFSSLPLVMTVRGLMEDENVAQESTKEAMSKASDSAVVQAASVYLSASADTNHDGKLNREELAALTKKFGFNWLKDSQIDSIFQRGASDEDGTMTFVEFIREAP